MNTKLLSSALDDIVVSILKQEDAPLSAETHLYSAIVKILGILPSYEAGGQEESEVLLTAIAQQIAYQSCIKEVN